MSAQEAVRTFEDAAQWESWLAEHHDAGTGVWLKTVIAGLEGSEPSRTARAVTRQHGIASTASSARRHALEPDASEPWV
jgi:hypothetical protein